MLCLQLLLHFGEMAFGFLILGIAAHPRLGVLLLAHPLLGAPALLRLFLAATRFMDALRLVFGHQAHGPAGAAFRRVAANHGDNSLFLAVVEHGRCAGPLLLVECRFQAALLITVTDLANGLRGERDHFGNPRRTGTFGQLEERQGAQHDPDLLYAAVQQLK